MADRNIDLVIRARDEAKATLAAISAELRGLGTAQDAAGKSAASSGSLISRFAAELTNLKKTADGITQFNKVAQQIDQIGTSIHNISTKAEITNASLESLRKKQAQLTEQSRQQSTAIATASKAYTDQAEAVNRDTTAIAALDKQIASLQRTQARQSVLPNGAQGPIGPARAGSLARTNEQLAALQASRSNLSTPQTQPLADAQSVLSRESEAQRATASALREVGSEIAKVEQQAKNYTRSIQTLTQVGKELSDEAVKVGEALGIDISQMDGAAAATARNIEQQERLQSIMSRVVTNPGRFGSGGPAADNTASYRSQQAAIKALADEVDKANIEVTKLGEATRGGTQGTEEQILSYQRAKAAAELLNAEYQAEAAVLNSLKAEIASSATARRAASDSASAAALREKGIQDASVASFEHLISVEERAIAAKESEAKRVQELTQRYNQFSEALDRATGKLGSSASTFDGLILKIGAYVSAYQLLKDATKDAIDYEAAQVRVTLALGKGTEAGAAAFQKMADKAEELKLQIIPAVDQYGKFLSAIHGTTLEGPKGTQIFEDLLTAARAFKLDPSNIQRATLALRDMAANGNVNLRYLRQLDQALPIGLLSRFATAAGYSQGQLHNFFEELHKGGISLDILPKVFAEAAAAAEKGLPAALKTAQSSLVDLQNAVLHAELAFTEGGFFDGLVQGVNAFSAELRKPETKESIAELGGLFGDLLKIFAAVIPYAKEITIVLAGLAGVKFVAGLAGFGDIAGLFAATAASARAAAAARLEAAAATTPLIVADEALVVAETEAAVAASALDVALAVLTGPAGIILGLGALATGILLFKTRATEASGAGDAFTTVLNDIKKSADGASDALVKVTRLDAQKAFPKEQSAFGGALSDLSNTAALNQSRFKGSDEVRSVRDFAAGVEDGTIPLEEAQKRFTELNATLTTDAAKEYANKISDAIDAVVKTGIQLGTTAQVLKETGDNTEAVTNASKLLSPQLSAIRDSAKGVSDTADQAASAWEKYQTALEAVTKAFPELRRQQELTAQQTDALALKTSAAALDQQSYLHDKKGDENVSGAFAAQAQATLSAAEQARLAKELQSTPGYEAGINSLVTRIIGAESGGKNVQADPNHRLPFKTSASGPGQFTDGTFLDQFKKVIGTGGRTDAQILQLKGDPEIARALATAYVKELDTQLPQSAAISANARRYAGYNLGAGDGAKFINGLNNDPNAPVSSAVSRAGVQNNPSYYEGKTFAQAAAILERIVGDGKLDSKGQTATDRNNQTNDQRIAGLKTDVEGINDDNYLPGRQAALNANKREFLARQENPDGSKGVQDAKALTAEQAKQLEQEQQLTAQKYDAAHAGEAEKKAVSDIVALQEQLKTAYADLKNAQSEGNKSGIDEQTDKIKGLKTQIEDAIPKAEALAKAFHDEQGLASLGKVQTGLAHVGDASSDTARQIRDDFTGDALSSIDGFFSDIEGGVKPFQALEKAALSFFSSILKQLANKLLTSALNSLFGGGNTGQTGNVGGIAGSIGNTINSLNGQGGSSGGGGIFSWLGSLFGGGGSAAPAAAGAASSGGGIFSWLASMFHGGGEVGSGMMSRTVNPMMFAGAPRFHDGGWPGLGANEVPVIAEKGERIMTKAQQDADARSKANASSGSRPLTNVLALGDDQVAAAIAGTHGEDVVLNHIKRNIPKIKNWVSN